MIRLSKWLKADTIFLIIPKTCTNNPCQTAIVEFMADKDLFRETDNYTVSVVMPCYHTGPVLLKAIKSVLSQKHLRELILVDNGNSNYMRGKIDEIATQNRKLHVLSGQGNIGFSRACNLGEHETKGDYVLLLNPDCVLPDNAFAPVVQALQKNPKAWVAGCKLVNPNGTEQIGNRRNLMNFRNMVSEWLNLYRYVFLPRIELFETLHPKGSSYVPAISGAFMMMERSKYKDIGGLDKGYFLHIEDMDFCFRVNSLGGRVIFVSDLQVVHYGSTSEVSKHKLDKHKARGLARYFNKNYKSSYLPGAIYLVYAIIYLRLIFQSAFYSFDLLKKKFSASVKEELKKERYLKFLESYKAFEMPQEDTTRDPKFYLSNRSPILISDIESQIGVCVLRRLLAANTNVIALYKTKAIDVYHKKLVWIKADIDSGRGKIDLLSEQKPRTLIWTSSILLLPAYLENVAFSDIKRIICFGSVSIFSQDMHPDIEKMISAEQDISRACSRKGIECTILRVPMVYGISRKSFISSMYGFAKKTGWLPGLRNNLKICQPVHADDLAIISILILNMESTYNRNYNLIGGNSDIDFRDMQSQIFEICDKKDKIINTALLVKMFNLFLRANKVNERYDDIIRYSLNSEVLDSCANAKNDFGYTPRAFTFTKKEDLML